MLELAISIDPNYGGGAIIETNGGVELKAVNWPQDCECQIVAYDPLEETCDVVWTDALASDIRLALLALERAGAVKGRKPDWYRRLQRCAIGAS